MSNCFTLASGAQQDLSEFLIPNQSEILTVVSSTTTKLENETLNAVNSSTTTLNNNSNHTEEITSENTNLQELITLPNLEQLDTFLVTSR